MNLEARPQQENREKKQYDGLGGFGCISVERLRGAGGASREGPLGPDDAGRRERERNARHCERNARIHIAQRCREIRSDCAGKAQSEERERSEPRHLRARSMPAEEHHGRSAQSGGACGPHQRDREKHYDRPVGRRQRKHQKREAGEKRDDEDRVTEPPEEARNAIGSNAHREVHRDEDDLVDHQDVDDELLGDSRLGGELRQEEHVHRPREREEELNDREIKTDAVGWVCHGRTRVSHRAVIPNARTAKRRARAVSPSRDKGARRVAQAGSLQRNARGAQALIGNVGPE